MAMEWVCVKVDPAPSPSENNLTQELSNRDLAGWSLISSTFLTHGAYVYVYLIWKQ